MNRPRRTERGSASLEYLGSLPFLFLIVLAGLQLLFVGTAVGAADAAARSGARAASTGGDGPAAGRSAVPGWLVDKVESVEVSADRETVRVHVRVPVVVPWITIDSLRVDRQATFPRE